MMSIQRQTVEARINASFNSGVAVGAARQKWASDAADKAVEAERAEGARVIGRDNDSGYTYHTALGDSVWDAAFDDAAKSWDECEAEFRRLLIQFDADKYLTPAEHAFNEIVGYDDDLLDSVFDALALA